MCGEYEHLTYSPAPTPSSLDKQQQCVVSGMDLSSKGKDSYYFE